MNLIRQMQNKTFFAFISLIYANKVNKSIFQMFYKLVFFFANTFKYNKNPEQH